MVGKNYIISKSLDSPEILQLFSKWKKQVKIGSKYLRFQETSIAQIKMLQYRTLLNDLKKVCLN